VNIKSGKHYYGDIPEEKAGNTAQESENTAGQHAAPISDWPLWEVFIRSKQGLDHKHVGKE